MYFDSLVMQSTLASEHASIENNTEVQDSLRAAEVEKKTLMKELDRVCDLMTIIDNDLALA